ncbi:MAG: galactose-1-phosphate uridylyltransferase [Candidatus Margulisbacteria bacterium]|nr:galactose-1-phosphate uridylyltransferase [Candidatus Margulisiibacteriota bacterium]MBU1021118.1 galactose-1-phosphate uridylyltransferase [Candidatus Margulisiibacteriota bacterium]MBU1728673.1 galactose-1-phosphate uridylyltransferase [Candidatus Margulisiibacteriota bacterium]MBU1955124.1 galactose-1-phosphate uridylyltransferase [Candidatus Margulisiibacteriota bacterium]
MPELRQDPISERWVVIATERGKRPSDFGGGAATKLITEEHVDTCPFCEGNESKTPHELFVVRKPKSKPDGPGWEVRVIQNKFPALTSQGDIKRSGSGLFDLVSGIGAHEVIIETPKHNLIIADMPPEHIDKILLAYKERIIELEKDARFRYVLVFKNYGVAAGTSLDHPHSQLIATPITPRYVKLELSNAKEYYRHKERCIFCDLIRQELDIGYRLVYENEFFIVFCPFASRFPFELWILPRRHQSAFQEIPDDQRMQLAVCLKEVLSRLKVVLNDPPFNYVLHTSPNPIPRPGKPNHWGTIRFDFHWHIEIIPRLTKMAGFEWGSGLYINPTPPEEAAKYLRNAKI